ncbi:MAG: AzlC family ABC transporter permease [candidate division NC10 bacterium]|nr:AzlC family ABC transporter permease [candidate division NC10 bacterium]
MDREGWATFRAGARAAVPVCVSFFAIMFAFGLAAHARGLTSGEALLMSAVVFAAPAQFPAIELLPLGGQAVQILLGTIFINLRFAVLSFALLPHFTRVRKAALTAGAQFISLSTFALSFLRFQRKSAPDNFGYFLGVAIPSYTCYLIGTAAGYHFGVRIPEGFGEAIQFIFPAYLTALLASELREGRSILVVAAAFCATPLVETLVRGWGLILTAVVVSTGAMGLEAWWESASPSS